MNPFVTVARIIALPWLLVSCAGTDGSKAGGAAVLKTPPESAAVHYSVPATAGPDALARLAIRHHPSIAAARHRVDGLAARVPQEAALPDPMLEVTVGREVMLELEQPVPFPGKRRESAAAAARESSAALAEVRALELQLTEQVHSAWWDLYLAEQTIALTRESRSVLEAIRDAVDVRVAAAQANQGDQIRLSNEITTVDQDLAEAAGLEWTAKARLNSLLNRPAGAALPSARGARVPDTASLETLLARAQAGHPEVAAAQERAEAFRHRLKRAELERYPDFTVGVTKSGDDEVAGMVGITLPFRQQPRRAMIREAQAGIAESEATLASTRADLRFRVEEAWYNALTAREVASLFETRLIPDSRQAYEITLTGYSAGSNSFTDLVETWRQILTYRLQLVRTRTQIGKAAATLRAAANIQ